VVGSANLVLFRHPYSGPPGSFSCLLEAASKKSESQLAFLRGLRYVVRLMLEPQRKAACRSAPSPSAVPRVQFRIPRSEFRIRSSDLPLRSLPLSSAIFRTRNSAPPQGLMANGSRLMACDHSTSQPEFDLNRIHPTPVFTLKSNLIHEIQANSAKVFFS